MPSSLAPSDQTEAARVTSRIEATVKGVGYTAFNLSASLPVHLVADPTGPDDLPAGLDVRVESVSKELGPYAVDTISNLLSVSGLLNCRVTFCSPPGNNRIIDIRAYVEQTSTLSDSRDSVQCLPERLPLAHLTHKQRSFAIVGSPDEEATTTSTYVAPWPASSRFETHQTSHLCRLESDKETSIRFLARLPSDDLLRPSTLEGTSTALDISHKLIIQINYISSTETNKTITITRPVTIASVRSPFSLPLSFSENCN